MKRWFFLVFLFCFSLPAHAAIVTKEIPYKDGDTELVGYLAYDDAIQAARPGVLVIHEWWGRNDYVKNRAEQLAKLGYVAFAADMYGNKVIATTPDEARELSSRFYSDRTLMRKRALAGLDALKQQAMVDPQRLAVMGYCFGGSVALEVARSGADIKGAVSFHGGLSTTLPARADMVKARLLVLNGQADSYVPDQEKRAFAQEMKNIGVEFIMVDYAGATHAFTNPETDIYAKKFNLPLAYNKKADEESWAEMTLFFKDIFSVAPVSK